MCSGRPGRVAQAQTRPGRGAQMHGSGRAAHWRHRNSSLKKKQKQKCSFLSVRPIWVQRQALEESLALLHFVVVMSFGSQFGVLVSFMTMRMGFASLSFEFYKKEDVAAVDLVMGAAGPG
jgi:hypothetical protein